MRRLAACALIVCMLAFPVRGAEPEKYAALTIEDGPAGKYTQTLLDGLAYRGAQATFLLCGYRMSQHPDLTRRIFEEGHEIAYHGYSHNPMGSMSRQAVGQELMDCRALLPEGCEPVFFRPPGGVVTDGIRQVAEARRVAILSWSCEPEDWDIWQEEQLPAAVAARVRDGDVLRLRDNSLRAVEKTLALVDALQQQGYRLVTVSELSRLRKIRIKPGQIYAAFPP